MIILGKDKTLDNYFINENGVITDQFGKIQELSLSWDRPAFKGTLVHLIQMWTNYGYRDTKIWVVHHIDQNKLNNSLTNLMFMKKEEHSRLHSKNRSEDTLRKLSASLKGRTSPMKGRVQSAETRKKISSANKGKIYSRIYTPLSEEWKRKISTSIKGERNGFYGKTHSDEVKKKLSESHKGRIWVNNGKDSMTCFPDQVPQGYVKGRLKINRNKVNKQCL